MSEQTERISSTEVKVLSYHDKGETIERIAELMGLSRREVERILATAENKRQKLISEAKEGKHVFVYYRPIDSSINVPQRGTMKVGSQIIKLLSEGIYSSPANSIKELVSNAFDADATTVEMSFDDEEFVVRDNGQGMDWADFDKDFAYISRSRKRDKGNYTRIFERPIIGFIGIGFIAVSELCDTLEIVSAKAGSDVMFEASIDFSKYRTREAREKEFYEVSYFILTNYRKVDRGYDRDAHFTEIRLQKLRPTFKRMLLDKKPFGSDKKSVEDILKHLADMKTKSLASLGKYWHFLLQLAYICPVEYLKNGPVQGIKDDLVLQKIMSRLDSYNFKVSLDGIELRKPLKFPLTKKKMEYELPYNVHPFSKTDVVDGRKLSFEGYIYSQHGSIYPKEYNGIIIRIRNVAIGEPDRTLLNYPPITNLVFRHWIFGEIYVTEGLEEAMNIDRSSFDLVHPHYLYLQNYIRQFLDEVVFDYTLNDYYRAKRNRKTRVKAENEMKLLKRIVKSELGTAFDLQLSDAKSPVVVQNVSKRVVVNRKHPVIRRAPKKIRFTVEQIILLFEIAMTKSEGDIERLKNLFLRSIREWM